MDAAVSLMEVDRLHVSYGAGSVLRGVSLAIAAGRSTALVGLNGAGKSTLARALCGLVPVQGGAIQLQGRPVAGLRPDEMRRLGVSYVPEGRGIHPSLTVGENLRMAARWLATRGERAAAVERIVGLFPVLRDRKSQIAGTMSGGEQQMLALARGLAVTPRLLIADELSLGLAPKVVDAVFEHLQAVRAAGVTVLLVEQFIHRALAFADTAVVLRRGEVVWSGSCSAGSYKDIVGHCMGQADPPQG